MKETSDKEEIKEEVLNILGEIGMKRIGRNAKCSVLNQMDV